MESTAITTGSPEVITTETTTQVVGMSEYEQEVLAHFRFQSSVLSFLLVCLVAIFLWKFLKQFF
jgi:hypothetical protein